MYQFEAQLKKGSGFNGWIYVDIPVVVSCNFRKNGRIKVAGTIDAQNFRTSLLPKGDGTYFLFVSLPIQRKAGKTAGDFVHIEFEEDLQPRIVDVPGDITDALMQSPEALATFTHFSYSHKKEITEWINDAKKDETRKRRIVKMVLMLENYRKPGR
ncbi:MAG TPA: YdeI/OmpD-associated family protein [Bacteroidales bacterium]|nr:YdeI/OmpD-associated family protein [Bacteroidales bacterium]